MNRTLDGVPRSRWLRGLLTAVAAAVVGCAQLPPVPPAPPVVAQVTTPASPQPSVPEPPPPIAPEHPTIPKSLDRPAYFPIGIFNVPLDDLGHARSLGFNMVQNYQAEGTVKSAGSVAPIDRLQDYLGAVESAGLGAMLGLPRHAIANGDDAEIRHRVEQLRGHSALKAWYLFDEPELQGVPASAVGRVARIVEELDRTRPTVLVLAQPPRRVAAKGYFDLSDVIMVDPYPYTRAGADISSVYRFVAEAVLLARGGRQVWATIQAHGRGPGGQGYGLLEPPYRELRNMVFQALAGGASGIFFFCYKCSEFDLTRTAQGMANVRRVVGEIHGLSALLSSPAPPRSLIRLIAAPGLVYRTFEHDGAFWLLVVNTARTELRFSAELRQGRMPAAIGVPAEDRSLASADGRLNDSLGPLDVRLYQVPLP